MLQEVFTEFDARLSDFGQVVIAGGAVRDTLLGRTPKDFDVFVLHDSGAKFQAMKDGIAPKLADLAVIPPIVEWHKSEPYLVASVGWHGAEVQVLANPAPSPDALVDTFDWSVCLYAFDGSETIAREPVVNIQPGGDLWLQTVTYPLSTLRRGFRFSERFHMRLKQDDVKALCGKILKKSIGNEPDMPALDKNVNPN